MASLQNIFNWFKTGLIPTQEQFEATFSSFFHKDDKLPISSIQNLERQLQGKLGSAHATDENAHGNKADKNASNIDYQIEAWRAKILLPIETDLTI